jgi:hypothetical protein
MPWINDASRVLKRSLLILFVALAMVCFISKILLDAYFLDNRPREPRPAEGRTYTQYIKVSYGDTVFLTKGEHLLSETLFPLFLVFILIGGALNMRWKQLAPYKQERFARPENTKKRK